MVEEVEWQLLPLQESITTERASFELCYMYIKFYIILDFATYTSSFI